MFLIGSKVGGMGYINISSDTYITHLEMKSFLKVSLDFFLCSELHLSAMALARTVATIKVNTVMCYRAGPRK